MLVKEDTIGLMPHSWVGWADLGALAWTMFAVLIASGTTALVVAGAITALAMIELLRHPIPEVRGHRQEDGSERGGTVDLSDSSEAVEQQ